MGNGLTLHMNYELQCLFPYFWQCIRPVWLSNERSERLLSQTAETTGDARV